MSFFKRLGLVEEEEPIVPVVTEQVQDPTVEVDVEINSAVNVVDEIYAQNEL
jgi:hypothetical protein